MRSATSVVFATYVADTDCSRVFVEEAVSPVGDLDGLPVPVSVMVDVREVLLEKSLGDGASEPVELWLWLAETVPDTSPDSVADGVADIMDGDVDNVTTVDGVRVADRVTMVVWESEWVGVLEWDAVRGESVGEQDVDAVVVRDNVWASDRVTLTSSLSVALNEPVTSVVSERLSDTVSQ